MSNVGRSESNAEGRQVKENPVGRERNHIWDNPKNVQKLLVVFWTCCAAMISLDFLVHRHLTFEHGELPIEGWFGFYAIYGFVACVLLVLVAKQMRKVLKRSEDYYDR